MNYDKPFVEEVFKISYLNNIANAINDCDDSADPATYEDPLNYPSLIRDIAGSKKQELLVPVTYSELKTVRDNSELVPGTQYRITDYHCTALSGDGPEVHAADHQFDIIVIADDKKTLNENARACLHEDDEYFDGCKLEAWELKYCIDNDTDRFDWADSTNGKGVIYYMKDEWNNECPYDFKNIQFYRKWNSTKSLWCDNGTASDGVAAYTFSSGGNSSTRSFTDCSLSINNNVYSNVIKEYIVSKKQELNNNCFFGNNCYSNSFGTDCYSNSFGTDCYNNTFGDECYSNIFGDECYSNIFGNNCYSNTFGSICHNNRFGSNCYDNRFGSNCYDNTFGDECDSNLFRDYCYSNTFRNYCYSNMFGTGCCYNTFGDKCNFNILGKECHNNRFGNACDSNTFGNSCCYNTFGSICHWNRFASNSNGAAGDYFYCNILESGVKYCIFYNTTTASDAQPVKNYHIRSSVVGTTSSKKLIEATRNLAYDTTVAMKSNGNIVKYCEADLIVDQN